MSNWLAGTIVIIGSYAIGGLPFGLYVGRFCRGVDLREHGSHNIGASNAWRVLGWRLGLMVFTLDLCKGLLPVLAANRMSLVVASPTRVSHDLCVVAAGVSAIVGHTFSPYLHFTGGKGVATSLGVAVAMSWKAAAAGFLSWAAIVAATGFISVGSMVGTPVGAILIWNYNGRTMPFAVFAFIAIAFVWVKHRSNVARLVHGTESRANIWKWRKNG